MIKCIVFDNNGVLTNSDKETTIKNFSKYFKVSEHQIKAVFDDFAKDLDDGTITTRQFYQNLADYFSKDFNEAELKEIHINSYQPKPGMKQFVLDLRENYLVALLTNFGDAFDEANRKVWLHDEVFDKENQFVSCKIGLKKPDLRIYEYALNSLGFKPYEVVFVDDRRENLVAASSLGIKGILFKSPKQLKNELECILENEK